MTRWAKAREDEFFFMRELSVDVRAKEENQGPEGGR